MPFSGSRYDYGAAAMQAKQAEAAVLRKQQELAESQFGWEKEKYGREEAKEREEWDVSQRAMDQMVREYNRAYGEAKTSGEQRYQEMLGISRGETQRQAGVQEEMLGVVGETTGQRAADIRSAYAGEQSTAMQRLARLGMSGTTVAPTMQMGYQREQQSALNRLADEMQRTKLGVMGQIAAPRRGTELGIMERKADEYPDPAMLTSTAQQVGYGGTAARAAAPLSGMRMY